MMECLSYLVELHSREQATLCRDPLPRQIDSIRVRNE